MPSKASAATGRILALTAVSAVALTTGVVFGAMIFHAQLPDNLRPVATAPDGSVPAEQADAATVLALAADSEPIPIVQAPAPVTVAEATQSAVPEVEPVSEPPLPPAMIGEATTVSAEVAPTEPVPATVPSPEPIASAAVAPSLPETVAPAADRVSAEPPATGGAGDPFSLLLLPSDQVEVAETEAQAIAIEERLSSMGTAYFQLPPASDDLAADADAAADGTLIAEAGDELVPAWATEYVNMRGRPDNEGDVLAILPAGTEFRAEAECVHWCEVMYEGQRGFIYTSFIRR